MVILVDQATPQREPACAECGAPGLLTRVHISQPGPERDVQRLLCPNCLADRVAVQRATGSSLEAELDGGKVARW